MRNHTSPPPVRPRGTNTHTPKHACVRRGPASPPCFPFNLCLNSSQRPTEAVLEARPANKSSEALPCAWQFQRDRHSLKVLAEAEHRQPATRSRTRTVYVRSICADSTRNTVLLQVLTSRLELVHAVRRRRLDELEQGDALANPFLELGLHLTLLHLDQTSDLLLHVLG